VKFLTRTLFGQLVCLLFIGLLASVLILQEINQKQLGRIHVIAEHHVFERYAAAWRLEAGCGQGCHMQEILSALGSDDASFRLVAEPMPSRMNSYEQELAAGLQHFVPVTGRSLLVHLSVPATSRPGHASARHVLSIQARLPDGRWLQARMHPEVHTSWFFPAGRTLLICLLPLILLVLLFTRRLQRPLADIARAAEQLGRGNQVRPLTETGPVDLRKVTRAFNSMQERLVRLINNRSRIAAAISHDLRSPLASLRIRTEMIDDPALQAAFRRTLINMQAMVDDALQFFRNDEQNEASTSVDLARLVVHVGNEYRNLGYDVCWNTPATLVCHSRELALHRSLGNLVENAVRYGCRARITLCAGEQILIMVDDDGPGIPEDRLLQAFAPFSRLGTDAQGGTGLGLTIVQSCVTALGGSVTLSNRPERGLRAIISLPA
jgi:signal transduction histidine kinase